jgi:hypothetical protein
MVAAAYESKTAIGSDALRAASDTMYLILLVWREYSQYSRVLAANRAEYPKL